MPRRKKASPLATIAVVAVLGFALLRYLFVENSAVGALIVIALIAGVAWNFRDKFSATPSKKPEPRTVLQRAPEKDEDLASFTLETARDRAPSRAPDARGNAPRWVAAGAKVQVQGLLLHGPLFEGSGVRAPQGNPDPGVIDPDLKISKYVENNPGPLGYYPNYTRISPAQRRVYLDWLAGGRTDSRVDVGYAFLYFYGLERRVLADMPRDQEARRDIPALRAELTRLMGLFSSNRSFGRYASSLVERMSLLDIAGDRVVDLSSSEIAIKIALGQCARDGLVVPASMLAAWVLRGANFKLPPAVRRHPELFYRALQEEISKLHPEGMRLRANRTYLGHAYRAAAEGYVGTQDLKSNLPDVSATVQPSRDLQAAADRVIESLARYTRSVGTRVEAADSMDHLAHLPVHLWPSTRRQQIEGLQKSLNGGMRVATLQELLAAVGLAHPQARKAQVTLQGALERLGMGIEPPLGSGTASLPADHQVVLFTQSTGQDTRLTSAAGQTAQIMLDLGLSVALADGSIGAAEMRLLMRQIDTWAGIGDGQKARLKARLRRAIAIPPSTRTSVAKIKVLDEPVRRALGHLLSSIAAVDGDPTADEVRVIEKTYKALGLGASQVYSDLHEKKPSPEDVKVPAPAAKTSATTISLDSERIAAIQAETQAVASLLAKVFAEEAPEPAVEETDSAADEQAVEAAPSILPGLDAEHDAFLRVLITRGNWTRAELEDLSADSELMLDGALERINEAAFERYNEPLIDGEDPVEIHLELLEKEAA